MATNKVLSMAELVNTPFCPEGWEEFEAEFVKLEDWVDKEIAIKRFTFKTSTNKEKYNQGNEKAVHFMFEDKDGKLYRTATHSKRMVKGFEALYNAINSYELEIPLATMIVKATLDNGRMMYDFKF